MLPGAGNFLGLLDVVLLGGEGKMRKWLTPGVVLFFLAPASAELLSGSAPPVEFFNPIGLAVMSVLYGGGAILARELMLRWKKGWLSLFVLGAAYAVIEEGLLCKSFFDPNWPDVGIFGVYGRWGGVNWVWTVQLTLYHTFFSIAIPIAMVEMLYPERRKESWVSELGFNRLAFLLVADVIFGFSVLPSPQKPYIPPIIPYLLAVVVVVFFIRLARWLPAPLPSGESRKGRAAHPFWFWLVGFASFIAYFAIPTALAHLKLHPIGTILILCLSAWGVALLLQWMSGNGALWTDIHRFALSAGAWSFFILASPIQELSNPARPDNTVGMTLVGISALFFLIYLGRKILHHPV